MQLKRGTIKNEMQLKEDAIEEGYYRRVTKETKR